MSEAGGGDFPPRLRSLELSSHEPICGGPLGMYEYLYVVKLSSKQCKRWAVEVRPN